jgi:hypothetical protein
MTTASGRPWCLHGRRGAEVANKVFANGREVACKAGAGKTICSMPDVCFTPPENPATPPGVPVPYPNTGMASDTTEGSKNVMISGEEVVLKNTSYFKTSSGDEAGCAAKKGAVSSKNKGKVYFIAWSMNVKFEGENAARHLDNTTNNHASPQANDAVPWPFLDTMSPADKAKCDGDVQKEKDACKDYEPHTTPGKDVCAEAGLSGEFTKAKAAATKRTKLAAADPCASARRCRLFSYNATNTTKQDGIHGCCPAQTGDHVVPKSSFFKTSFDAGDHMPGWEPNAAGEGGYNMGKAPCMCLEGGSNTGSHGLRHAHHKAFSKIAKDAEQSFDKELDHCADGAVAVAPACDKECLKAQLKEGHKPLGDTSKDVKHSPTGKNYTDNQPALEAEIQRMIPNTGIGSAGV